FYICFIIIPSSTTVIYLLSLHDALPIFILKPGTDVQSEVVMLGESVGSVSGRAYRDAYYERGLDVIKKSLSMLEEPFDFVIMEGAGSPVEVNLKDKELVNMKVAELADVPVILVADINRGG